MEVIEYYLIYFTYRAALELFCHMQTYKLPAYQHFSLKNLIKTHNNFAKVLYYTIH